MVATVTSHAIYVKIKSLKKMVFIIVMNVKLIIALIVLNLMMKKIN